METFSKSSLKRLLYIYLVAVIIVAVYFIAKTLFQEERVIETKKFKVPAETSVIEQTEDPKLDEETRFILMPKH
jgi:multidrug resistance efflux pump